MSNDYRASPLSNQQIEEFASLTRQKLGLDAEEPVDMIEVLRRDLIPTKYGLKSLSLKIVPDGSLGDDDARTFAFPKHVTIEVEDAVWARARKGQGRDIMTLAHELGHAVLHEKPVPLGRAAPLFEAKRPDYLSPYEASEHQAKYFASAFLMPKTAVVRLKTASELVSRFKVSLQAAGIRLKQCVNREPREIPEATRLIIDELKANALRPPPSTPIAKDNLTAWDQLPRIQGEDPTEYRQTYSGYRIKKSEHNKVRCLGWFLENGKIIAALERHDCS